jgi:hypothetical protein
MTTNNFIIKAYKEGVEVVKVVTINDLVQSKFSVRHLFENENFDGG